VGGCPHVKGTARHGGHIDAYRHRMFRAGGSAGSVARARLNALRAQLDNRLGDQEALTGARHALTPTDAVPARVGLDVSAARAVVALGIAAVVGAVAVLLVGWPRSAPTDAHADNGKHRNRQNVLVSQSPSASSRVVVDVDGEVRRPGVVTLPQGARVIDAIKRAGGTTRKADTGSLNLAQVLVDGAQVVVAGSVATSQGSSSALSTSPSAVPTTSGVAVNINTATEAELDTLPGIGPVLAAAIVQWRTENGGFTSVDQLQEVSGIGPATFADIASLVHV
jgi:competence protein ComEA